MTRMTAENEIRREHVENALARLGVVMIWQEQVSLRIRQALERDGQLRDLLEPGIELNGIYWSLALS